MTIEGTLTGQTSTQEVYLTFAQVVADASPEEADRMWQLYGCQPDLPELTMDLIGEHLARIRHPSGRALPQDTHPLWADRVVDAEGFESFRATSNRIMLRAVQPDMQRATQLVERDSRSDECLRLGRILSLRPDVVLGAGWEDQEASQVVDGVLAWLAMRHEAWTSNTDPVN